MTVADSRICPLPPVVDLYIAPIPDGDLGQVFPPARQAQIDGTTNEAMRRQRYYVWKLLEHGLLQSLGLSLEQLTLQLSQTGKWSCCECYFSLSHCRGAVAVAVSTEPVGVDIELTERIPSEGLAKKILSPAERAEYDAAAPDSQPMFLLEKWCQKESIFKITGAGLFTPATTHPGLQVCSGTAGAVCYAVATEHPEALRVYQNIRL